MKYLVLLTLGFSYTAATAQTTKPSATVFAGTWRVQLVCNENYCAGPKTIKEKPTGGTQNQVWTLSQKDGKYILDTGDGLAPLTGGTLQGEQLGFSSFASGSDPAPVRGGRFTLDKKGQLTGNLSNGNHVAEEDCITRYKVTGRR